MRSPAAYDGLSQRPGAGGLAEYYSGLKTAGSWLQFKRFVSSMLRLLWLNC